MILSRLSQVEYVAALKEIIGMDKSSQIPDTCLRSSEDILTEEFINSLSNETGETKLYNITSGTYTFNYKSECLLTIFERGKIRMVDFKERMTRNESNNHIFHQIKREK